MSNLLGRFGNFINDAGQHMQSLQGDPMFNMGIGLLAAGGNRRGPKVSVGQGLMEASQYANQQSQAYNQLQGQRQALQAQKRQQNAIQQLPGLLNNNAPVGIRAPQALQQQRLSGLLAQANPQAFTQSLIRSQFAQPNTPAIPREAALAQQMFPSEPLETSLPKVMAMMNQADPQDTLNAQKTQLEIAKLMGELQQGREAEVKAEEQEEQQTRVSQNSIDTSISTIGGIAQNLNKIKGTSLQTGAPFPEARRGISGALSFVGDLIGMDTSERQEMNTALDLVNKDLNGLVLDTLQNFGDRLTVQQTRILQEASANENITPQAIASVLEVALEAREFAAQNDPGLSIRNQDQIDAIKSLLGEIKTFGGTERNLDWRQITGDLNGRNNSQ